MCVCMCVIREMCVCVCVCARDPFHAQWKHVNEASDVSHLCCIGDTPAPWMETCCRPCDRMSQNSGHTVCVSVCVCVCVSV